MRTGHGRTLAFCRSNTWDVWSATPGRARQPTRPSWRRRERPRSRSGTTSSARATLDECAVRSRRKARVRLTPQTVEPTGRGQCAGQPVGDAGDRRRDFRPPRSLGLPGRAGDCEDLVLLKRRDLIEKGWPVGALLDHGGPPEERRRPRGADGPDRPRRPGPRQPAASRPRVERDGLPVREAAVGIRTAGNGWQSTTPARLRSAA